jgi:hypothetical protein
VKLNFFRLYPDTFLKRRAKVRKVWLTIKIV